MKIKRVLSLLLALSLVLLAGCGTESQQPDDGLVAVYLPSKITTSSTGTAEETYTYLYADNWLEQPPYSWDVEWAQDEASFVQGTYTISDNCQTMLYSEDYAAAYFVERAETYYDDQGNVTKTVIYHVEDASLQWQKTAYAYDDQNHCTNITSTIQWDDSQETSEITFTYEETDGVFVGRGLDADGVLVQEIHYDGQGNQTALVQYDTEGVVTLWVEQTFDEHGNVLTQKQTYYGDSYDVTTEIAYEYTTVRVTPEVAAQLVGFNVG